METNLSLFFLSSLGEGGRVSDRICTMSRYLLLPVLMAPLIQKFLSSTFSYNSEILQGDSPHSVPVGLQSVRGPPRVPRLLHGLVSLNSNL